MFRILRYLVFAAVAFPLASSVWAASPGISREQVAFTPSQTVVVKLHQGLGPKIVGEVIVSDVDTLVVEHKSGERIAIDWDSIRLIKKKKAPTRWIGMAAGLAAAGVGYLAAGESLRPASAAFFGVGAASGAVLASYLSRKEDPLYEAPSGEAGRPSPTPGR